MNKLIAIFCVFFGIATETLSASSQSSAPGEAATEHVLLVMTDGLRWQEVFNGADPALLTKENNGGEPVEALRERYVQSTPEASRAALMPFLWSQIVPAGEIYGNRSKGSEAYVTNGLNFSYPGYSETLTGHPDPRIKSNDNIPNPNVTVFEWLNRGWESEPSARARQTAAFGAWEVIGGVFNQQRCGFTVNVGYDPLTSIPLTPQVQVLNQWKAEAPHVWPDEPFDAVTFHTALEYLKTEKPRLFYLSLGETDDWAHGGQYGFYLEAAHRVDTYLQTLWEFVQADPEYRGHTTLIFLTDHGRGAAPVEWKSHGVKIAESKYIFLAAMGVGVPARGELGSGTPEDTQSPVAAPVANLFGKDWNADTPTAGKPLPDIK